MGFVGVRIVFITHLLRTNSAYSGVQVWRMCPMNLLESHVSTVDCALRAREVCVMGEPVETNPITDEHKRIREAASETVELGDPRLSRVTRLRLVTDPGFPLWDVSYCYGRLKDGT